MRTDSSRGPAHDLDAERALLGDVLALPSRLPAVMDLTGPGDLYDPGHAAILQAMEGLWRTGQSINAGAVLEAIEHQGDGHRVTAADLVALQGCGSGAPRAWAERVARLAFARRLHAAAAEISEDVRDRSAHDPAAVHEEALARLAAIDRPAVAMPDDLTTIDEIIAEHREDPGAWVVPGLLRSMWRAVIVAPEGHGKSVLFRQVVQCVAAGVHPFTTRPIPAVRTLLVDLENPSEAIVESAKPLRDRIRRQVGEAYREHEAWVWHRPGGINLRARRDRQELESVIAAVQPGLIALGPLYKAYRTTAAESDELAAGEVQAALDDLRTRYRFAILAEHHAPKKQGGVRDLQPYGSSLWLRWPEFGLKLVPEGSDRLTVQRWRGDRLKAAWPIEIQRGHGGWPWEATYAEDRAV